MIIRQTVSKEQMENAERLLKALQREIDTEYIGLISTSGVSLINLASSGAVDTDTLASLAAGSFAATGQLAAMMEKNDFSAVFHEGSKFNIYIAQTTSDTLLVICFRRDVEIGKVRLVSKRALHALAIALEEKPGIEGIGVITESAKNKPDSLNKDNEGGQASGSNKSRSW